MYFDKKLTHTTRQLRWREPRHLHTRPTWRPFREREILEARVLKTGQAQIFSIGCLFRKMGHDQRDEQSKEILNGKNACHHRSIFPRDMQRDKSEGRDVKSEKHRVPFNVNIPNGAKLQA